MRKALLDYGTFSQIHAFPQKDNPARRVFYDAKLSTALFAYWKGREDGDEVPFIAAVHPAQFIEPHSPSLRLSSSEVGRYDSSNLTIVSCGQVDWDIATQITKRPGMGRHEFESGFDPERTFLGRTQLAWKNEPFHARITVRSIFI